MVHLKFACTNANFTIFCSRAYGQVQLNDKQLEDLKCKSATVVSAAEQNADTSSPMIIPLGEDGLHLSLTRFKGQQLVHLRYFERGYWDVKSLFPTKKGVTLKLAEFEELIKLLPTIPL